MERRACVPHAFWIVWAANQTGSVSEESEEREVKSKSPSRGLSFCGFSPVGYLKRKMTPMGLRAWRESGSREMSSSTWMFLTPRLSIRKVKTLVQ
jgi:hypothetical protein